jgi:hypothetical protein
MSLRRSLALTGFALAVFSLVVTPAAARAATDPTVDVLAVGSTSGHRISLVTEVQPAPLIPLGTSSVTVSAGGARLSAQVNPVLSGLMAVGLVIDASAAGGPALQGGGLSGVASFLLQLPPDASTAVIADRRPPVVAARASAGVTGALQAASALSGNGARATSDALTLALHQLPTGSDQPSVIVLYTSAPDAGGESATALGRRLHRTHAILAVVNTSSDSQYWAAVATATGGLAVAAQPAGAVKAFDALADALRTRYVLTFPRPQASAVEVSVQIDATASPVSFAVPLPPEPAASGGSTGASSGLAVAWRWVLLGALVVLAVAVLASSVFRRRRRRRAAPVEPESSLQSSAEPQDEPDRRPALPGVRVFDVANPAGLREITNSLFEPRAERDLREGAAGNESPAEGAGPNEPRRRGSGGSFEVPRARREGAEDRGVQ